VPLETVYATIAFGKKHGVKTLLNPAPANANLALEKVRDLTLFAPNETELAALTGLPVESDDEVARAAESLVAKGVEAVVVTLGARGALLVTASSRRRIAPVKVQAVDTTGAGDAFIGSFACDYAGGASLEDALNFAARYAADSVTRRGTQKSYATRHEFEQRSL
jgi:ribokinase